MIIYWLLYLIPSILVLVVGRSRQSSFLPWILIGFLFTFIIGFRHEVGADWFNYIKHYENMSGVSFFDAFEKGDPGHKFLNWLMYSYDLGVYGINLVYGALFVVGLVTFSRVQIYPWIAMAVAVPYLVIVVAMGYSRQGVAIGLFMLAVVYLQKGKFKTYVLFILIAALFHKTALVLLPLGVFLYGKGGMIFRILLILPVAYGAWDMLVAEEQQRLWHDYVEAQMQSDGAKIRVAMNLIPSLLLFKYRKEWKRSFNDYSFWYWIALGSILSVGMVNFSSTAVDRMALYFIPIQLVVFSRLPYLVRKQLSPNTTKFLIIFGYALVLFVWLNFASHSEYWLPYQNIIFKDLF